MKENKKIIKIRKNQDGDITDVMLNDGEVMPVNHAIMMAKDHEIEGVGVFRGKDGGEFLVPDPEIMPVDNINDLPNF